MGFLLALTVVCAVLVRCGAFGRGETLEDLAKKQEQAASENTKSMELPEEQPEILSEDERFDRPKNASDFSENSLSDQSEDKSGLSEDARPDQPENESDRSPEDYAMEDRITYQENFYYESLSDTIKARITGISYPGDDSSAAISYDSLRYVHILYYDFNGDIQSGELLCHKAIARDLVEIFYELYEADYPIEKICLVDEYQGDDNLSMEDNNTSCFNYRALPSGRLSNHAYGLAIDLNPFYNPYITTGKDGTLHIAPAGSEAYADREQSFDHKIDKEDLAYRLFIEHGFTWGGSWRSSKDYQHFEKAI